METVIKRIEPSQKWKENKRFKVPTNFVRFQHLYTLYLDSDLYKGLSKRDKRIYNRKYILNLIKTNKDYKHRMYYDGIGCDSYTHVLLHHKMK